MSESLMQQPLGSILDALASRAPTPGGGSVAAITGAMAAGLVSMVCELTIGKPQFAEVEGELRAIHAQAEQLRAELQRLADEDIAVFNRLAAAYKLPRTTEADAATRKAAIQQMTRLAAEVPLRTAQAAAALLPLCTTLANNCARLVVSDVGVAVLLVRATVQSAALNVEINLAALEDQMFVRETRAQLQDLLIGLGDEVDGIVTIVRGRMTGMSARILDGRALAQELRAETATQIAELRDRIDRAPTIAVVQVGDDPAATRYVRSIDRLCQSLGAACRAIALPATTEQADLEATVSSLSADDRVDGILLQLPLPAGLSLDGVLSRLVPEKDLDGIHPINAGLLAQGRPALTPNTPAGGMELLRRYGIEVRGKRAAVVGRSPIVGRPMALLLLQADATVTICHSRTPDLGAVLRECDIIAAAAGRPGLITADMIKPGATVIDFGTNVLADGSMVGDVDYPAASEIAGAITPVPGGTGPVTNMMLMQNLIKATRMRLGI